MSHPEPPDLVETVEKYISLIGHEDVDGLVNLFADFATVEDPVGGPVRQGRKGLMDFYRPLPEMGVKATLTGPVRVVPEARSAAFPFRVEGAGTTIDVIDTMTFDREGKITTMVAYWSL